MQTKPFPLSNRVSSNTLHQLHSSGAVDILPYAINPKDNQEVLLFTDSGEAALASYKGNNHFMFKPAPAKELRSQMSLMLLESFQSLAKSGNVYSAKDLSNPSPTVLKKLATQCLPTAEPATVTPLITELTNMLVPVER